MARRMGRFRVSRENIDDNLGEVIYRGLVPLEVRYGFDHDGFDVLALGPFDLVPRGQTAPMYQLQFDYDNVATDGGGTRGTNYRVRFVKTETR